MSKKVFTAIQQAKELERIAPYGVGEEESVYLWGNTENGEVVSSIGSDEYSKMDSNPEYEYIKHIFDFKYNVEYVYEDGLEALIECNNLRTFEVEVKVHKLALLNCAVLTGDGVFQMETISLEKAKELVQINKDNLDSAIGHQSTAEIMTTLLGEEVVMNRQRFQQEEGQSAIVFSLNGRPEEGKILTKEQIEEIGYSFKLLTKIK